MSVNINEFEVVIDPPQPSAETAPSEAAPLTNPRGATPHEVESILRRTDERLARLRAH
jgi:hypothetical protein